MNAIFVALGRSQNTKIKAHFKLFCKTGRSRGVLSANPVLQNVSVDANQDAQLLPR